MIEGGGHEAVGDDVGLPVGGEGLDRPKVATPVGDLFGHQGICPGNKKKLNKWFKRNRSGFVLENVKKKNVRGFVLRTKRKKMK